MNDIETGFAKRNLEQSRNQMQRINNALRATAAIGKFADRMSAVTASICNGENEISAFANCRQDLLSHLKEIEHSTLFVDVGSVLSSELHIKRSAISRILGWPDNGHAMTIIWSIDQISEQVERMLDNTLPDKPMFALDIEKIAIEICMIRKILEMTNR